MTSDPWNSCLCPDLTPHWTLKQSPQSGQMVLHARQSSVALPVSATQGYALRYFTGHFTVEQVQEYCHQGLGDRVPPTLVVELLQWLLNCGVLAAERTPATDDASVGPRLRATVQWIAHPDGYWLLRNPDHLTYFQVSDRDKVVLDALSHHSPQSLIQAGLTTADTLHYLFRLLRATGMLEGTTPPSRAKQPFNPLHLLSFKLRLFNPDAWLERYIHKLHWIWTAPSFYTLLGLLSSSLIFGLHQRAEIQLTTQQFLTHLTPSIILSFIALSATVVTLHELGHALTLKHYRGVVPEVGLRFIYLMPIAYTNTTDQYGLPKQRQRALVVAAGVVCQVVLAAIAFWIWNSSASGSWLWSGSYLLMMAALFTVALNLNPLAKFDGYYLAVALTGINNLRQRSFQFYSDWLNQRPSPERWRNRLILAAYAPLSLVYILSVFGFLLLRVGNWIFTYIPATGFVLVMVWLLYARWRDFPKPQ